MHRPESLPPITQPQTAYHGGVVMSTVSDLPTVHSFKRSPSSTDYLAASSASTSNWPANDGLSTSNSEMPSPSIQALDSVAISTPSDIHDPHYRGTSTISSSSSTMTLKRSYLRSQSSSQLSYMSTSSRRESYLPHSPLYRDSIQIVPPQPLGFGGSMALATDQKTLVFSSNSGIGGDDLTKGLVWTADQSEHSSRYRKQQRAQQERKRYLMEGPVSTRTSEAASQMSSSQSSPVTLPRSLNPTPASEIGGSRTESPQSNMDSVARLDSNPSVINPHLLGAKDSPLQRLQSNAAQAHPPSHTRLTSSDANNGDRSDSDASPILSPFVHHSSSSSPPSTRDGVTDKSDSSSSDAADPNAK